MFGSITHFLNKSFGFWLFVFVFILVISKFWILIFCHMCSWHRFFSVLPTSSVLGCSFPQLCQGFWLYEVPLPK